MTLHFVLPATASRPASSTSGWLRWSWYAIALVVSGVPLQGGGPLVHHPASAFRWDQSKTVQIRVEAGPLSTVSGAEIANADGARVVRETLQIWSDATHGALQLDMADGLDVDVNADNFMTYLEETDAGSPIVFDADGEITAALFGPANAAIILGFANSEDTDGDGFLDFGRAVLNGLNANLDEDSSFRSTVLHEFGHMLGLDHTQAGGDLFDQCGPGDPSVCAEIPVMYPLIRTGAPAFPESPRADDQAWILWLYPSGQASNTGSIEGRVLRRSGYALQGANVVAVPVSLDAGSAQAAPNLLGTVSCVSDFLYGFDGRFELPGLAPGDYEVFIEPLYPSFDGSTAVGPFFSPWANFEKDYFNGPNESGEASDDPGQRTLVHVAAGETVHGLDLVSNDSSDVIPGNTRILGDDDALGYIFPPGFVFPFFGRLYRGVFVNSDGSLTFDDLENYNVRRDEARFLHGPPRIAPLFRDLNPAAGGSVSASIQPDSVTFSWDQVPRYRGPRDQGNSFSVTLHANGDISFHYDRLFLSEDEQTGIAGLVGVSPGRDAVGPATTFASLPQPVELGSGAVYQVLEPASSLPTEIRFVAAQSQLLFPLLAGDQSSFTGFAVSNDSGLDLQIQVEALAADGDLQAYPDNPHIENLGVMRQFARVGSELFGLAPGSALDGWVRMTTTSPQLGSFFQFGSVIAGAVTRLDGSLAITAPSTVFYFTRVYDGPQSFPAPDGPQDALTTFLVANPGQNAVQLTFQYFLQGGQPAGAPVQRMLPPLGCLRQTFSQVFGALGNISSGFVRVTASGDGAVGFELIETSQSLMGLNAATGNNGNFAYSAQLAHGESDGTGIFTSLKLVNVSDATQFVTLTALSESGSSLGQVVGFTLQPNQSFQNFVGMIFGLGPATGPAVAGSIRVESTGPGVIGDVIFGDPSTVRYAAALPLQTRLLTRAVFSQVANANGPDAARTTFTGLAFHNPSAQMARVMVRVFREDGTLAGQTTFDMAAGTRRSDVLSQLVPESAGQARGYIEVRSTQPIVAQQLFGNLTLEFLSATPPTVFQ